MLHAIGASSTKHLRMLTEAEINDLGDAHSIRRVQKSMLDEMYREHLYEDMATTMRLKNSDMGVGVPATAADTSPVCDADISLTAKAKRRKKKRKKGAGGGKEDTERRSNPGPDAGNM